MRSIIKEDIKKDKKGQIAGILTFVGLSIAILILAPVMLKINGTLLSKTSEVIGNQSTDAANQNASQALQYGVTTFNNLWDTLIVIAFFFNIVILLVSSFMIDVHPAFWVLYLVAAFIFFFCASTYTTALDNIWNPTGVFADEITHLSNSSWIQQNFTFIMLGVYFITGVIIFAKIRK